MNPIKPQPQPHKTQIAEPSVFLKEVVCIHIDRLATSDANVYPPGVFFFGLQVSCRFSLALRFLFFFRFRFFLLSLKPRLLLVQSLFVTYACAPVVTCS